MSSTSLGNHCQFIQSARLGVSFIPVASGLWFISSKKAFPWCNAVGYTIPHRPWLTTSSPWGCSHFSFIPWGKSPPHSSLTGDTLKTLSIYLVVVLPPFNPKGLNISPLLAIYSKHILYYLKNLKFHFSTLGSQITIHIFPFITFKIILMCSPLSSLNSLTSFLTQIGPSHG